MKFELNFNKNNLCIKVITTHTLCQDDNPGTPRVWQQSPPLAPARLNVSLLCNERSPRAQPLQMVVNLQLKCRSRYAVQNPELSLNFLGNFFFLWSRDAFGAGIFQLMILFLERKMNLFYVVFGAILMNVLILYLERRRPAQFNVFWAQFNSKGTIQFGVYTHISTTVSTHTFQAQFQHTHFNRSFNTHISGTVPNRKLNCVPLVESNRSNL